MSSPSGGWQGAEYWLDRLGEGWLKYNYFWDMDDNCWEILTNPKGGYSWLFEQGDQEGKGHLDKKFVRPGVKQ